MTLEVVLAWSRRGTKYDAYQDRAIIEGSLKKGLNITSGWYAVDYYRRMGMEIPEMIVPNTSQWRSSKERNRQERIKLAVNQADVFSKFMRHEYEIDKIATLKDTDARTIRRWLGQSCTKLNNPPLKLYVTSVAKVGTTLTDAGRLFRLKKLTDRQIAKKLGIPLSRAQRYKNKWKTNPLLGFNRKQVLKMARMDQLAARRKAKKPAKPDLPKIYVRAVILEAESKRMDDGKWYTGENGKREVRGWWDGKWLTIEDEVTPTGRLRRKTASRVVELKPVEDGVLEFA